MAGGGSSLHLILSPTTLAVGSVKESRLWKLASQPFPVLFSECFSSFPGAQGIVVPPPPHLSPSVPSPSQTLFWALSSQSESSTLTPARPAVPPQMK